VLRWAQIKFTGVMKDFGKHLLDTSTPPAAHLANGFADWDRFEFRSLEVVAVNLHGERIELVLSGRDPSAALRGLEKYRRTWEKALRKWFECEVIVSFREVK